MAVMKIYYSEAWRWTGCQYPLVSDAARADKPDDDSVFLSLLHGMNGNHNIRAQILSVWCADQLDCCNA